MNRNLLLVTLTSFIVITTLSSTVYAHEVPTTTTTGNGSSRGAVKLPDLVVIFAIVCLGLLLVFYQMQRSMPDLNRVISVKWIAIFTYAAIIFNMVFSLYLYAVI